MNEPIIGGGRQAMLEAGPIASAHVKVLTAGDIFEKTRQNLRGFARAAGATANGRGVLLNPPGLKRTRSGRALLYWVMNTWAQRTFGRP